MSVLFVRSFQARRIPQQLPTSLLPFFIGGCDVRSVHLPSSVVSPFPYIVVRWQRPFWEGPKVVPPLPATLLRCFGDREICVFPLPCLSPWFPPASGCSALFLKQQESRCSMVPLGGFPTYPPPKRFFDTYLNGFTRVFSRGVVDRATVSVTPFIFQGSLRLYIMPLSWQLLRGHILLAFPHFPLRIRLE